MVNILKNRNQVNRGTTIPPVPGLVEVSAERNKCDIQSIKGARRRWLDIKVALHIIRLALKNYRSVSKSIKVLKSLYLLKKLILGGIQTKIIKVDGKYYHYMYAPGYPSRIFDSYIEAEFHRVLPLNKKTNTLTFIHFAVTKKCPLQCEHCLEWNNLNKKESFSTEELEAVVHKFQNDGITQFHLSGGEPMVRIRDILPVIAKGSGNSEFYMLTSGFNFTAENAAALKTAGLTGVIISLDHFDPEKHNAFRGFANSYNDVISAVRNAQNQNLVIGLTICVTRSFASRENLMKYSELAKSLKVTFIQLLEPKAIGHYEGKDVLLGQEHTELLDEFFCKLNFDPVYEDFPIVIYHGYYQRRTGCFAGGNRTLYIDTEGWANACPFCHTKNFNIKSAIENDFNVAAAMRPTGCMQYKDAPV